MNNFSYAGTIDNVVDGDTIDIKLDLGFKITHKIRVRLLGVDAPEVRGEEKERGLLVKKLVVAKIAFQPITIQTHKTGKYGRWLGVITNNNNGECLNEYVREIENKSLSQLEVLTKEIK